MSVKATAEPLSLFSAFNVFLRMGRTSFVIEYYDINKLMNKWKI